MFSAESSGFVPDSLCFLMSFARCSAQLNPAGPAPTISTSASSCSRCTLNLFCLLQLFGERGHDFENVADYAVIGDFEDRRVLILVDRDYRARALHTNDVLNGAADSERQIQFWRDSLPGAADLALHREPAF